MMSGTGIRLSMSSSSYLILQTRIASPKKSIMSFDEKSQSTPLPQAQVYGAIPPQYHQPIIVHERHHQRPSLRRRILRGFVWVVASLVLIHAIVPPTVRCVRRFKSGESFSPGSAATDSLDWVDINIGDCVSDGDWTSDLVTKSSLAHEYPFSAKTSLNLPLTSNAYLFAAKGTGNYGSFDIVANGDSDDIVVEVVAHWYTLEAFEESDVCLISRSKNDQGVAFITPHRHHSNIRNTVRFEVTVHLPASKDDSPLKIKEFETSLPLFHHHVGNLAEAVSFDRLSLSSSNSGIEADSVTVTDGVIKTSNSKIEGTFNASHSLYLTTHNAPITAEVFLHNKPSESPSELIIDTKNAHIDAAIKLLTPKQTGGSFDVQARSANAPIDVHFHEQPVDSTLHGTFRTSNAPAVAKLHAAYEGEFTVSSSILRPNVEWNEEEDPKGEDRHRNINFRRSGSRNLHGSVAWSEENKGQGTVTLSTSNSPATLKL